MRKLSLKKKIKKNKENGEEPAIVVNEDKAEEKEENVAVDDKKSVEGDNMDEKSSDKKAKNRKSVVDAKEDDAGENPKGGSDASDGEQAEDEPEEAADEEEYEVEDIVDHKVEKGKTMYLIRWKGYGPESNTWEQENTLACPDIVAKYKKKMGAKKKGKRSNAKDDGKTSKKKAKKVESSEGEEENEKDSDEQGNGEDHTKDDPNQEWEVEKVVDVIYDKDGCRTFRIRWKGYKSASDTWEPESNLNCSDLIEAFMKKRRSVDDGEKKELRDDPKKTQRYAMNSTGRRSSKRNTGRQRTVYYDAE